MRSAATGRRARTGRRGLRPRPSSLVLPGLLLFLGATPAPAASEVLRVGVVDGSPPCSFRVGGSWSGLAVELWSRVATEEGLPYVLSAWPNPEAMLAATRQGRIDVAVGCLNVSPERLATVRFTLPFQEDGQAVLMASSRLDLGRAFLASLFGPTLLHLLGGYLLAVALLTAVTWRVEAYGHHPETMAEGWRRSFSKLFQVLATGPGSNTIVRTIRGNGIVVLAYLVRIVAASLLVGYLTVNVVRETQERKAGGVNAIEDLRGRRVAVRPGSVSEALLREINRGSSGEPATVVPLPSVPAALTLLEEGRVDAVLADNLQLTYLLRHTASRRIVPLLALRGIRPESQAFALSPLLPESTGAGIDRAISRLKRSGTVAELRQRVLGEAAGQER